MGKIPPTAFYAMVAAAGIFAYFGYCALLDLLKQRKAEKAAAAAEPDEANAHDELIIDDSDEEPPLLAWSANCSCGWNVPVGTSRGYFLARTEDEARVKLHMFHNTQVRDFSPGAHELDVFPYTPPS